MHMDRVFNAAVNKNYDRKWMPQSDLDGSLLYGWTSRHKLDQLVRHGAVVVGDILRVTYESAAGNVFKDGQVWEIPVLVVALRL